MHTIIVKISLTLSILAFCFIPAKVLSQDYSMTSRFRFWLLNNEARALSALSFDQLLSSRIQAPLAILPPQQASAIPAAEDIWTMHRKFYVLLEELDHVFNAAIRFGNGRFTITVKKARPEIWGILAFHTYSPWVLNDLYSLMRRSFYNDLIAALNLDPTKDVNLSTRLANSLSKLNERDVRLFNQYLNTFSALYPSDNTAKLIKTLLQRNFNNSIGQGLTQLLRPEFVKLEAQETLDISNEADEEIKDPLAELEQLAEMEDFATDSNIQPVRRPTAEDYPAPENTDKEASEDEKSEALEESDPEAIEMFNIWE
ncbi:MAG: hypothetical protein ACQETH_01195 [Candidatus Rifleibacteriota bacterium]